jgi:hypothetical protein
LPATVANRLNTGRISPESSGFSDHCLIPLVLNNYMVKTKALSPVGIGYTSGRFGVSLNSSRWAMIRGSVAASTRSLFDSFRVHADR